MFMHIYINHYGMVFVKDIKRREYIIIDDYGKTMNLAQYAIERVWEKTWDRIY
jgi:hypothetical protein